MIVVNVPSSREQAGRAAAAALFSVASIRITRSRPTHPFSRPRFNNRRVVSQLKLTLPSPRWTRSAPGMRQHSPGRPPRKLSPTLERGSAKRWGRRPTCSSHRVNKCRRRKGGVPPNFPADRFDRSFVDARLNSLWRNFRL